MLLLIWILNFAISWFNAWGCGKTWNETKAASGWPHFMNWCGAIMSASGFTWCYLVIAGLVGANWPVEADDGTMTTYLEPEALMAFAQLGYLMVIVPILGSGLAIMIHSWGVFWREKNFGSGAVAGWNTFANVYNMYNAVKHVPDAASGVGAFFKGDSDAKTKVLVLAALSAVAGIATTYLILTRTARATALERGHMYEAQEAAAGT